MIELNEAHWTIEGFKQRMASKEWKELLLSEFDSIIVNGNMRKLIAKNLGFGVVEVYKEQPHA